MQRVKPRRCRFESCCPSCACRRTRHIRLLEGRCLAVDPPARTITEGDRVAIVTRCKRVSFGATKFESCASTNSGASGQLVKAPLQPWRFAGSIPASPPRFVAVSFNGGRESLSSLSWFESTGRSQPFGAYRIGIGARLKRGILWVRLPPRRPSLRKADREAWCPAATRRLRASVRRFESCAFRHAFSSCLIPP